MGIAILEACVRVGRASSPASGDPLTDPVFHSHPLTIRGFSFTIGRELAVFVSTVVGLYETAGERSTTEVIDLWRGTAGVRGLRHTGLTRVPYRCATHGLRGASDTDGERDQCEALSFCSRDAHEHVEHRAVDHDVGWARVGTDCPAR